MKKLSYIFETGAFLSPIELDNSVLNGHNYHYYMIVTSPIIYIKDCYLKNDTMSFLLNDGENDYEVILPKSSNDYFLKNLTYTFTDQSHTSIKAKYDCILKNKKSVTVENEFGGMTIYHNYVEKRKFRIEYIGQSYADDGHRTAQERLSSHSTLQKILAHYSCSSEKRDVLLFLLGASAVIADNTIATGSKSPIIDISEVDSPEYVNLLEAFLINYFKPKYNSRFVTGIVPSLKHDSYTKVLNEQFEDFSVNVAIQGSVYDYVLFTDNHSIEVDKGILKQDNRIYVSFDDANIIDPNNYEYSFLDYIENK